MTSLLAVLRDRLGIHFTGKQFVGGWHRLAPIDRALLHNPGRPAPMQAGLGMGASLGARAWDQGAGLALDAPALRAGAFASLLPGGRDNALLGWLVARHLQCDLQVQVTLRLAGRPDTRLAAQAALAPVAAAAAAAAAPLAPRLGLSTWLCSPGPGPRPPQVVYQQPRFVLANDAAGAS